MKKILLIIVSVLFVAFILIQFIRPQLNLSDDKSKAITRRYPVSDSLGRVLRIACYDCHSDSTRYPWYDKIQPVAWWLNNHIAHGKRALNFSTLGGERIAKQYKKMGDIKELVDKGEMPLNSYLWIHKDAVLTPSQKESLFKWTDEVRDSIKAHYPADSLIMPKKKTS